MSFPPAATQLLREGTARHELLFASSLTSSNLSTAAPDPQLPTADVLFGQPDPEAIKEADRVRWTHLTSAGYERYDRPDFREAMKARRSAVTNSSSVYMEPCAEHALAMIFSLARLLPASFQNQAGDRAWPAAPIRAESRLLTGQTVLLLGYGAIARRLAELLQPLHVNVIAIRRTVTGQESVPAYPESRVEEFLPLADHVVNVLPGGEGTKTFMTASRFSLMKPTGIFYNIGRGGTIDQDALQAALNNRVIMAAYLDVTSPEPLPADHPLWTTRGCFITPHTAGGHHDEHARLVRHFLDNLERFVSGAELVDRVI